jgi:hypothetical protein
VLRDFMLRGAIRSIRFALWSNIIEDHRSNDDTD